MSATFFLLFLAHLLGDFYFQSHNVAVGKQDDSAMLRKHCRYYGFTLLGIGAAAGCLLFHSCVILAACLLAAAAHAIIDVLKFLFRKRLKGFYRSKWCFLTDQALHLIMLAVISSRFRAPDTLFFFHWTVSSQDIDTGDDLFLHAQAKGNLAAAFGKQGNSSLEIESRLELERELCAASPLFPDARIANLHNLASAYYTTDELNKALKAVQLALKLAQEHPPAETAIVSLYNLYALLL